MKLKKVTRFVLLWIIVIPFNSVAEESNHPYYDKPPGDPAKGAIEWANNCNRCHNVRNPAELTDDTWHVIVNHMRIRAGLTGQQARDILAYITSSNFTPVAVSVTDNQMGPSGMSGEQIYSNTCIACHGADGKGAISGVPDLAERLTKPNATLVKHVTEGFQSPGSPMMMPPKGGNPDLTHEDIESVLDYMHQEFGK